MINYFLRKFLRASSHALECNRTSTVLLTARARAAERFNRQYHHLSLRTSGAFHDRFVIIDDDEYYHFGHSLKDLGKKGCMFSRIEEPVMIKALSTEYIQRWQQATQII